MLKRARSSEGRKGDETADAVDLTGWTLHHTANIEGAPEVIWTFPSAVIPPNGHLLVYASGKDLKPTNGDYLHTNFVLHLGGGNFALTCPGGGQQQSSGLHAYLESPADVSFCYFDNGWRIWGRYPYFR
jgi:hypothetical protein